VRSRNRHGSIHCKSAITLPVTLPWLLMLWITGFPAAGFWEQLNVAQPKISLSAQQKK
jgi:hypothetical protein